MDKLSKSVIELLREEIHSYKGLKEGCFLNVFDLTKASHREMMAFLSKHNLDSPALDLEQQLAIISRHNSEEIMLLIDCEGLYEKAGLELISTCSRKEISQFAKLQYCFNSTINALLQRGYYQEVDMAMGNFADDMDEDTITLLIEKKCEKALVYYLNGFDEADIENFPLNERCSTALILSRMEDALSAYIKKSGFPYGSEQIFIEFSSDKQLKEYLLRYKLFDESGIKLIKRGNMDLVDTYIVTYDFGEKSEIAFFEQGWSQLEMEYVILHQLSEKAEKLLIHQEKEDVLIEYLNHAELSLPAMFELIKSNLKKTLICLIAQGGLPKDFLVFLVQKGSTEILSFCVEEYSALPEEAEFELITQIELKGEEYLQIMRRYLEKTEYYLDERAETAWMIMGNKTDIKLYISNTRLRPEAEKNLISRGDSELIILYLQKFCPCEEAVEMLLERGIKDEIKILLEQYYPQLGLS